MIGPLDVPHEFVYVPDVADTLLKLSKKDEAYGKRWNLAGVGLVSFREFAEKVFALESRKPTLRSAGKFTLQVIGIFKPMMREFAEMDYLMTEPLYVDDTRLRGLIPDLAKTSYDDGIKETLELLRAKGSAAVS